MYPEGMTPEENEVAELLDNIGTFLTEQEQKQLRDVAERSARSSCEMVEIATEAARRISSDAQGELNAREAVARYYLRLTMQEMERVGAEELTKH